MIERRPPRLATWLIERFAFAPIDTALLGDFVEEYAHGRSRFWYWRQVVVALFHSFIRELRLNPWQAVHALLVGWVFNLSLRYSTLYALRHLPVGLFLYLRDLGYRYPLLFRILFGNPHSNVFPGSLVGWIVFCVYWTVPGWFLARVLRAKQAPMVLLFSLSILVWNLRELPWDCTLAFDALDDSKYVPYLLTNIVSMFAIPALVLIGGLWGNHKKLSSPVD